MLETLDSYKTVIKNGCLSLFVPKRAITSNRATEGKSIFAGIIEYMIA